MFKTFKKKSEISNILSQYKNKQIPDAWKNTIYRIINEETISKIKNTMNYKKTPSAVYLFGNTGQPNIQSLLNNDDAIKKTSITYIYWHATLELLSYDYKDGNEIIINKKPIIYDILNADKMKIWNELSKNDKLNVFNNFFYKNATNDNVPDYEHIVTTINNNSEESNNEGNIQGALKYMITNNILKDIDEDLNNLIDNVIQQNSIDVKNESVDKNKLLIFQEIVNIIILYLKIYISCLINQYKN